MNIFRQKVNIFCHFDHYFSKIGTGMVQAKNERKRVNFLPILLFHFFARHGIISCDRLLFDGGFITMTTKETQRLDAQSRTRRGQTAAEEQAILAVNQRRTGTPDPAAWDERIREATREVTPEEIKEREEAARVDQDAIRRAEAINFVGKANRRRAGRPIKTGIERQYYGVVDLIAAGVSSDKAIRTIRAINQDLKELGIKPMQGLAHKDAIARYIPGIVLNDNRAYSKAETQAYLERSERQAASVTEWRRKRQAEADQE